MGGQRWAYARLLATMYPENNPPCTLAEAMVLICLKSLLNWQERGSHYTQFTASTLRFEPGSYLEIIPWEELTVIPKPDPLSAPSTLLEERRSTSSEEHQSFPWVVWAASGESRVLLTHYFVAEEQIYEYCLLNNYCSPNYLMDDKVCFMMTPLEDTPFLCDIITFWSFWVRFRVWFIKLIISEWCCVDGQNNWRCLLPSSNSVRDDLSPSLFQNGWTERAALVSSRNWPENLNCRKRKHENYTWGEL